MLKMSLKAMNKDVQSYKFPRGQAAAPPFGKTCALLTDTEGPVGGAMGAQSDEKMRKTLKKKKKKAPAAGPLLNPLIVLNVSDDVGDPGWRASTGARSSPPLMFWGRMRPLSGTTLSGQDHRIAAQCP